MKITKARLKQIIKEELEKILNEEKIEETKTVEEETEKVEENTQESGD